MGCYLITETMARRHQLSMSSYDRLFPNQDTMPRGGFGNLIALPLQQDVRRLGNTVFLDVTLEPLSDQWANLASLTRIETATVEGIAEVASRRGTMSDEHGAFEHGLHSTDGRDVHLGSCPKKHIQP